MRVPLRPIPEGDTVWSFVWVNWATSRNWQTKLLGARKVRNWIYFVRKVLRETTKKFLLLRDHLSICPCYIKVLIGHICYQIVQFSKCSNDFHRRLQWFRKQPFAFVCLMKIANKSENVRSIWIGIVWAYPLQACSSYRFWRTCKTARYEDTSDLKHYPPPFLLQS